MARPRIRPSARSIPISFSVKPDLADKIEEYSHQLRFSRSKFLAQAVTEAITKIEMGYDAVDFDVRNMTDNQRIASALNAFNTPTPEQEINPVVVENLKNAIALWEASQPITGEFLWKRVSDRQFANFGDHNADFRDSDGTTQSTVIILRKKGRGWESDDPRYRTAEPLTFKTLKEAKERTQELYLQTLNEGR